MVIYRWILLRVRNIWEKFVERIKTHIWCSITLFKKGTAYETKWKNIVDPYMEQMKIWRMRIARWLPTAKNTHSDNVRLIFFPRWLFSVFHFPSCPLGKYFNLAELNPSLHQVTQYDNTCLGYTEVSSVSLYCTRITLKQNERVMGRAFLPVGLYDPFPKLLNLFG